MTARYLHTMVRITDPDRSRAFYEALGMEFRRELPIVRNGELEATNYFLAFPGQEEELELTLNHDGRTYDNGTGYGHIAIGVDDLDATLARLADQGIEPERPPYQIREGGSFLCFVRDPDDYRIEIIGKSQTLLLLYNSPVSGNCYKVRLLLARLGLEYEREDVDVVDRTNRPELLGGLNPALRVPTIILDDGRPLAESGAILWFLGEGTRFVPDDPYERAQVLQWMFFEQYETEPTLAVVRFWVAYSGLPAETYELSLEAKMSSGYRALDAMEKHLDGREWFVGRSMTLADIALYAYTHVAHEGGFDLERYPAIRAWLDRVAAEPGHVPIDA